MFFFVRRVSYLLLCLSLVILTSCKIQGTIQALPETIEKGQSTTLSWSLGKFSGKADKAVIEPGIGVVSPRGALEISPAETTTYTITWSKKKKSTTSSVTVTVMEPPAISITSDKQTINVGDAATLSWVSENVTSCSIEPEIGSVDVNGSITVTPEETTTYIINAQGTYSSVTSEVTIHVNKLPSVEFSVDKPVIGKGDSATLAWATENASSCSIEPDIGAVDLTGSVSVTPLTTTTYTITASNGSETDSKQLTITVTNPPAVTLTVDKTEVSEGGQILLSWTSENADTITLDNGIGVVEATGTRQVTPPAGTTTYTISATDLNNQNPATASVTVTSVALPSVSLSVDKTTIEAGDSITLTWISMNAVSCSLDQGIGNAGLNDSLTLSLNKTTTFTISAINRLGDMANDSVTVTVADPPQ